MTRGDLSLDGVVIPAHPLALTAERRLDERHQRALTRYYLDAGADGVAVGVHSTQFAVHDDPGLLTAVLGLASDAARDHADLTPILVAGVLGPTEQAVREAELARDLGYRAALLMPVGVDGLDEDRLLERAAAVGEVLPTIGFYLQPAVGGRPLGPDFWRRLADQDSTVAIKIAPFDRYRTLDVLRGVGEADRGSEIALLTGNDDSIATDLLLEFTTAGGTRFGIRGGLLGQWAVWTRGAVELRDDARLARNGDAKALRRVLDTGPALTAANAAIFDAANSFHGCIPGINEVLRRHGLLAGRWCLDPAEDLSPGQEAELDRIWRAYPDLRDDDFIEANKDRWLT